MKNTDSGHDCSDTLFKKSPAGFLQISRLSGSNEKKKKKKKKERISFATSNDNRRRQVWWHLFESKNQTRSLSSMRSIIFLSILHPTKMWITFSLSFRLEIIRLIIHIYMSRYYYFSRLLNDDRTSMLVSIPFFYSFNSIPSEFSHHDSRCYLRWQLDDYVFKVYHVYLLTFIHLLGLYIYYY